MVTLAQLVECWNSFFHSTEPVATLALFRILFGAFCVFNGLLLAGHLQEFYGPRALYPQHGYDQGYGRRRLCLFNVLPVTANAPRIVLTLHILASMLLTVGFMARTSAIVAWITILSLHHRNPCVMMAADNLQRFILFLLAFSNAGAGLSVDCLLQGQSLVESISGPGASAWCTRLIQCQIALLYWQSFLWKMTGKAWRGGTAVYYALQNRAYRRMALPSWMLSRVPIALVTYGTLATEASLGTLIWIDEFRHWVVCAGWLLHLGIELTMNLHLFEWLMCICIFLFVKPELTQWIVLSVFT